MNALTKNYVDASADDQAKFLLALFTDLEHGQARALEGSAPVLDLDKPRCPKCGNDTALYSLNVSIQLNDAHVNNVGIVADPARCSDFHASHWLTACCNTAVALPEYADINYV